ncbi:MULTISPECIES: hypothetical protein [Mammaliicoccus]|uniref:Uncharacterized protein n=1 Tax=Mammaliicoccus fleurettii TaxID=150056 RepID=A0ABS5MNT4_9STAP|nr:MULTISPECIES: hypothetical protein [Mammaliicoccus]HCN60113.1 hypothetical protein [Staphylococcus sp.]MBL0847589.1 hypothetical protein [Mammaliicoccus fleurettii]MBO3062032.1 hypothetical protein [Mammaliicoccus fleurettii]MBS3672439.1 hypothetical protein [Mammaliicoccus fleurettii]MBS3697307.1 hypothetical protein [Mammaliicoccus fleurettii]
MKCVSCNQEMINDLRINVPGTLVDVRLIKEEENEDILKKAIAIPKAAVCLKCGEVKYYIEDIESFRNALDQV